MGYSREFIDELRSRIPLSELIDRRVKLTRRGREWAGLCPFHRERTPSFYVVEDRRFFHCFGCGAHGDAIGFVMRADGLDFGAAIENRASGRLLGDESVRGRPADTDRADRRAEKRAADRRRGRLIWDHALDPRGTCVETYLAVCRELSLPPAPAAALRWGPACAHPWTHARLPAMIARITGPDGEMIGLHRTYLRDDGRDKAAVVPQRAVLGSRKGGAVRFGAVRADRWLIVAEGIETTLALMQAYEFERPGWAALCNEGMESLALPRKAQKVLIAADHDRNGVGERSGRAAGKRFIGEGRRVRFWRPLDPGTDANDVLMRN